PALDGADHPARAAGRTALRPARPPSVRERRHGHRRRVDVRLLALRRARDLLGSPPGYAPRRPRHGHRDGADDGGRDALRPAREGRRRLGGAEQHAPGRRVARDRDHGRDRRVRHLQLARCRASTPGGIRGRVSPRDRGLVAHRARRCRHRRGDAAARSAALSAAAGIPGGGVTVAPPVRMAAADRRRHLIETAILVFSEGSYRGTTTAEIARAAGVSEPILYRHFASKRELYLAALDHVWTKAKALWEQVLLG